MPKYDLAVVDAGLGGLTAAAYAASVHKKAVVLESDDNIQTSLGVFAKNGFTFHPGPALSFGFERGGPLQQISESLGIVHKAFHRSPCYQIALPDRRITVYAEQSQTLDELSREFPREADRIARCYHKLREISVQNAKSGVSAFFSARKKAGGFLKNFGFSREFLSFLDVQSYYFFDCPAASLSLPSLITLLDSSPLSVPDGFVKLGEQLVDVLHKKGGEIRYDVPVSEISPNGRITIPNESIDADTVLLNDRPHEQQTIIGIGIREEVLPAVMLDNVLCMPDYSHPERFYSLSVSAKDDATRAPRGMRALTASFSRSMQCTIEQALQSVSDLIPFLNNYLLFAEESRRTPGVREIVQRFKWKPVGRSDSRSFLSRSADKRLYMLTEGHEMPVQAVAAARQFVERIK